MVSLMSVAVCLLTSLVSSQRAPTWEECDCEWDNWNPWSTCDAQCFGKQQRSRNVWMIDSCSGFEYCDAGAGGYDDQACNTVCTHGSYDSSSGGCQCPGGRYGQCCTDVAESCNSNPCQNGATCVNGLELYTCVCPPGWSGVNCEADVQPPVMSGCENKTDLNTADHQLTHEWTVPTFTDPLDNEVTTTSNYVSNSYRFPWGDFFVQYVATKTNNGLQKECKFQINVRPYPCDELSVPTFGYVACNGWRTDFGQYCLIGCRANYTLPRDISEDRWYVCGASGMWSSDPGMFQCEDVANVQSISGGILGSPDTCDDVTSVQELYISELEKSNHNSVCRKHHDLCSAENVSVRCR
ncbi:sushi, von Willebrand factor type A, EGF and pentraxin domain-containing protein 1-like [Haliotis rubra]|uniref:sushi, von Willebrand factor type A, EGF and pentraxin domain-containing protein 1-like n=1 Tax=Haliotis rubra TaxID=36100 RepID=UPI001EE555AD|nr:sushi, von Willebrand factor type A, EGF and pentraxin domain-containing protein 1-like [Haliotis rubra]